MQCRPQQGLGRAVVLCAFAEAYRFDGGKSVSESIHSFIAGWLNPDQSMSSGRCRVVLTPT
ncbi:hypothetical protein [Leptolyngbya ohadii]|uniref:hypothetical protein n=1 Tax=Leptolyngbya ohadii TaxID=1962290 RepID=UPI00117AE99E|nr:hypothetical protein [Leptolyngbya ohadii]